MSLHILREFFRDPHGVGALAASGAALSRRIVASTDLRDASMIVEYGPGTGSFTRRILEAKPAGARLCAIERNAHLAERFRRRFPEVPLFEDSAENVREIVRSLGESAADCVVSGLPWANFASDLQDRLLAATRDVLRDGGTFVTFAYLQGLLLPAGRRFRRKLRRTFSSVRRSRPVWNNLPPAFVYICRR